MNSELPPALQLQEPLFRSWIHCLCWHSPWKHCWLWYPAHLIPLGAHYLACCLNAPAEYCYVVQPPNSPSVTESSSFSTQLVPSISTPWAPNLLSSLITPIPKFGGHYLGRHISFASTLWQLPRVPTVRERESSNPTATHCSRWTSLESLGWSDPRSLFAQHYSPIWLIKPSSQPHI